MQEFKHFEMITNKCSICGSYTFSDEHCGTKIVSAHYKFIKFVDKAVLGDKKDILKSVGKNM